MWDFAAVMSRCAHCFFGPIYRKNWEKNNKNFRNDDYGPESSEPLHQSSCLI